jgi:hypothetical protein
MQIVSDIFTHHAFLMGAKRGAAVYELLSALAAPRFALSLCPQRCACWLLPAVNWRDNYLATLMQLSSGLGLEHLPVQLITMPLQKMAVIFNFSILRVSKVNPSSRLDA